MWLYIFFWTNKVQIPLVGYYLCQQMHNRYINNEFLCRKFIVNIPVVQNKLYKMHCSYINVPLVVMSTRNLNKACQTSPLNSRTICVGFMADKVTLGQFFSGYCGYDIFTPVHHIQTSLTESLKRCCLWSSWESGWKQQ